MNDQNTMALAQLNIWAARFSHNCELVQTEETREEGRRMLVKINDFYAQSEADPDF